MAWDDELTGVAHNIAACKKTPLRVLAGPRTGKTFALMRRVARLLEENMNPKRILKCTFTRTAATDLKNSILELGIEGAEEVEAKTLHFFCFGLLAKADVLALIGRSPRPL
jgi:DNA helicase-2/ATP-dependent DNA helicase PcrA